MEPDEGGCYHFPEQVTEDASSTSSASAYPTYASALSPNVRLCGPDVITTAGSIMTNGVDCLPGELPGATAVSFGSKTGLISEINETQDISFAPDRQDSFHCEVFGSDSTKGDLLPVFSPPDILSSSGGRIMSAAVDLGRSMEGSCMESSATGGEQSKQLEYALCFQGSEDLQNRIIRENAVDGMHGRAADQNANDFVAAFSQSHFFRTSDFGSNEESEAKKPFHSTMQTYEQSYSYSGTGHGFSDGVETAATELKSDDLDIDKAIGKVKDTDSLMSVSSPVLCSIVSGMPLRETSDAMDCLSFGPLSLADAGRLTKNNVDFPEGSGSPCAAGTLNEGTSSSQSLASFISNVDCLAIDGCKDKELCGYGLRNCSLSLYNGEKDEIFDKPAGQNHESLQNPVLCRSDGTNRSNRKDKDSSNGTLHLAASDVHDEESLCLSSSETPSLPAAFRLSGSCSSDNSSRSGSISSTGGKFSDISALDNDKAMKIDASNKCTTSVFPNKAEIHSSAVNVSPAASNSDSSRGIPATLARAQPVFPPPSSSGPSSSSYEVPQNISLSPPLSSNINLPITQLGRVAPTWLPDSEAPRCMQCDAAFSFTKRRHHCRACGKIFCGNCSNLKSALHYLENKESRVCSKCYQDLIRAQYYQKIHRKSQLRPNPNNPSEYCSVISPLLQVQSLSAAPLPSIMVPTSGVLRKQGSFKCKSEAKQVMFSDGIRPGGDLTEVDGLGSLRSASANVVRQTKRVGKPGPNYKTSGDLPASEKLPIVSRQSTCLIPSFGGLPPVVVNSSSNKGYSLMDSPTMEFVLHHMRNADLPVPVTFVIDKYLAVIVKIVNLDCCVNRVCWSFTTKGMRSVGQDEIVILLECFPDEQPLPTDVLLHLHSIYQQASQGNPVNSMGHTILPPGCFGSLDHGGFLFIRHTFQCLERLILPEPPYLFGILLQKWEIAWAKVFPLRLLLRLGAEFRYYPCPLVSVRDRRPVYGEIGHTIMNLLADFHNYQYMVSHISGLVIHLELRKTTVRIPSSRYDAVMKVLNSTNGHVLALGADFSASADSHLVCVQNEDGSYQTQAINHQKKACKVTGASFAVFNGALKPTPGTTAKSSVVEDGVMIQVTPSTMSEIKQSWKNMKNVTIDCGCLGSDDIVTIEWVDDSTCTASNNLKSPVDGMPLDGREMRRIHGATDYAYDDHVIRWTEIFLLCNETNESTNVNRLIDQVAQTACTALVSHSSRLTDERMTKIGLRVTVGSAEVSFKAGSNNHSLPDSCIYELEEKLLPLLQKYLSSSPSSALSADQQGTLAVELIFNVLHLSSMITSTYAVNLPD